MDSDGSVAYEGPRGAGLADPRANPAAVALNSSSFLTDGRWHMASLTTQTNTTQGFRCAPALPGLLHILHPATSCVMVQAMKVANTCCSHAVRQRPALFIVFGQALQLRTCMQRPEAGRPKADSCNTWL